MLACRLAHLGANATIGLLSSLLEKNVYSELSALRSGKLSEIFYGGKRIKYMLIDIEAAELCCGIVVSVLSRLFQCPQSCRQQVYRIHALHSFSESSSIRLSRYRLSFAV